MIIEKELSLRRSTLVLPLLTVGAFELPLRSSSPVLLFLTVILELERPLFSSSPGLYLLASFKPELHLRIRILYLCSSEVILLRCDEILFLMIPSKVQGLNDIMTIVALTRSFDGVELLQVQPSDRKAVRNS